jgi:hypothetical protein
MPVRLLIAVLLGLTLGLAAPALAAAPSLPAAAEPLQFYAFSFTDTPAEEAAQDVVVGALARDLQVDPAVDGLVTFRADGWYSDEALLQDFGTALLDQDIALMRTGPGAYAVVPSANVPMLMARGGTLMRLPEPASARAPSPAPASSAGETSTARRAGWWDNALAAMLLFFAGAAAGAAALFGGQIVHRRAMAETARLSPPLLRLTDQRLKLRPPVDVAEADPELIIPRFEDRQ